MLRQLRELVADRARAGGVPDPGQPEGRRASCVAEAAACVELEEETGKHFHFEGGEALRDRHLRGGRAGTREEIEERALPFRVGEEVLVTIEEPHMYNADDAIARVDSYIVSVGGGGRHVGERRLVRIEERRPLGGDARRCSTTATAATTEAEGDERS